MLAALLSSMLQLGTICSSSQYWNCYPSASSSSGAICNIASSVSWTASSAISELYAVYAVVKRRAERVGGRFCRSLWLQLRFEFEQVPDAFLDVLTVDILIDHCGRTLLLTRFWSTF